MLKDLEGERAVSLVPEVTRWKPIDILCKGGVSVRAKLVRCPDSAAVCIAEGVGHEVLRLLGLDVAEPHALTVSAEFAEDITKQFEYDKEIIPGRHWATTLLTDQALSVEFREGLVDELSAPDDLVTLYIADVILANPDRRTHGNVLLRTAGKRRTIVPIDQSECFNHPSCLRSQSELNLARSRKDMAAWLPGTELVVLRKSADLLKTEVQRAIGMSDKLVAAPQVVPDEWYERAGTEPARLSDFLAYRLQNLNSLVDTNYWTGLASATKGAITL